MTRFFPPVVVLLRPRTGSPSQSCDLAQSLPFTNARWVANTCAYGLPSRRVQSAHRPYTLSSSGCRARARQRAPMRGRYPGPLRNQILSLIRHDDGYFVAGPAAAADVHFCLGIFLIAVYDGISQCLAERQLDVEFLSRNTWRSLYQQHQAVHQWRDRLNLAGHPRVDFQNGRTRALSRELRLEIRCSVQAPHSTHWQTPHPQKECIARAKAPTVPERTELVDLLQDSKPNGRYLNLAASLALPDLR
jgi:hypothetical protein